MLFQKICLHFQILNFGGKTFNLRKTTNFQETKNETYSSNFVITKSVSAYLIFGGKFKFK